MFFCVFHIRDRFEARACHSPKGVFSLIKHEDDPYATMPMVIGGIARDVLVAVEKFNDLPYLTRYEMCQDIDDLLSWLSGKI